MDLATFAELLAPAGQAAIADAAARLPTEATFLSSFEKLRKRHPPALAKAALETVILRDRGRAKFSSADRMYFTREALEQSTGEIAARHRAARFKPFGTVADLGCGIGGDTLALAEAGLTVHAVESDPLRLAMAEANARSLGLAEGVTFLLGDALSLPLPDVNAAFADPSRRDEVRRHLDPEQYSPPLSAIQARFASGFPLAVKIAPGVASATVAKLGAEVEFVSVAGELKECVLWFGPLRSAARRATVLPSGLTLAAESLPPLPPTMAPGAYVFDPDPAVVRAGLAGQLVTQHGLAPIDETVMILTGDEPIDSQFVTTYRVEAAMRYHVARLREMLRERKVGRVTVVKRGSMIDADELVGKLKLAGTEHRVLLLTRAAGEQCAIVCERFTSSA